MAPRRARRRRPTTNSAGCFARSIAARIAARSLVMPLAVSVWTVNTGDDLVPRIRAQRRLDDRRIDRYAFDPRLCASP
jgi:hypothetical protein